MIAHDDGCYTYCIINEGRSNDEIYFGIMLKNIHVRKLRIRSIYNFLKGQRNSTLVPEFL